MPADRPNPPPYALDSPDTSLGEFDSMNVPFDALGGVDLPLGDLAAARPPAIAAKPSPHRTATAAERRGGRGRAVLVVDGAAIARKFLATRLQSLGYQVTARKTASRRWR